MDIKLIALDLDGTLLNSEKKLSDRNRQALMTCMQRGIEIVPTTGRTVDGIPSVVKEIPGLHYAITTNGAVIRDLRTGREIDSRRMPGSLALEIIEKAQTQSLIYDVYIEGRGKMESRFYRNLEAYHISPVMIDMIHMSRDEIPGTVQDYIISSGKMIEKVNMFFADEETRIYMRRVLAPIPQILVTSSMPNNLEINYEGAAKGEAILRLAGHLGICPEQTMAFGDGENDFNMIAKVGCGVAMSNGEEALKAAADYVTCSNDEDGVAAAIEKLIL